MLLGGGDVGAREERLASFSGPLQPQSPACGDHGRFSASVGKGHPPPKYTWLLAVCRKGRTSGPF
jgi:hypothetical protein